MIELKRVHCFFEQSGTFKNEFKKLGYEAEDYDIQNNFGQTDHVIDLFGEIEKEYDNLTRQDKTRQDKTRQDKTRQDKTSVFANINPCQDLIMAFFPCIYFETMSCMYFSCDTLNNSHKPMYERMQDAIDRIALREKFYTILYKLCYIVTRLGIKLIIENPATIPSYLLYLQNFFKPTLIDGNRQIRGDYFKKPTAYWFFGFLPTVGCTRYSNPRRLTVNDCKSAPKAGICSEERSLIAPEYAHNFICDFILGLANDGSDQQSFDFGE